ncbi:hypothetical protein GCM10025865_33620 (plasmid) [Paraoerskovia sediminicola]|uniref:Colicin import membrane protein n=1 Tax=Paraoerskovia sediminicola TaxID=1138587 RepID=A0ABM8G7J1_9CELL|nr:hypothetical protein GCM10025865_33620 [Paraoerskovia sediminicola]
MHRPDWWANASAQQIGETYGLARAWANEDPEAAKAEQRMREELRARHGIDANNAGGDPAAVQEAVDRARRDKDRAEALQLASFANAADRSAEQAATKAESSADPALVDAASADVDAHREQAAAARHEAAVAYDSAERREETASTLESHGVAPEIVATRMRADVDQAKPATEATRSTTGRAPKARSRRGSGAQIQRTGVSR